MEAVTAAPEVASLRPIGRALPVFAMLAATLIWGGSFIATKASVAVVPPVAFAVLRFAVALAGLLAAHAVCRVPIRVPRAHWGAIALAGLTGVTATYALENVALMYTTAGNTALFIAVSPLITVAGAFLFLGERLSRREATGGLLAFVGMIGLVGGSFGQTGLGDLLMALNAVIGAFYGLVSKRLAERLPALTTLTASFAIGLAGLLPIAAAEALLSPTAWTLDGKAIAALVYLGLGSSGLAYWLWMVALARMTATRAGLFLYVMPVVTLGLSAWLLAEPLGPTRLCLAVVILCGVFLACGPGRRAAPEGSDGELKTGVAA